MPTKAFRLPNIYGAQDIRIAENALQQLPGVQRVEIEPDTKEVTLHWNESTTWDEIKRRLETMGYFPDP